MSHELGATIPSNKHAISFCMSAPEQMQGYLGLLLPVLVSRLGSEDVTEPSEELRLQLVSLLFTLVEVASTKMAPYLDDMMLILQRTIVDPYPELKKVRIVFCARG